MNEIKTTKKKNTKQTTQVVPTTNWLNYADKVSTVQPEVPNVNLVNANDMNAIKWTVMQGIPIFFKGQVIMFYNGKEYENFLNLFKVETHNKFSLMFENDPLSVYPTFIQSGNHIPTPQDPSEIKASGSYDLYIQSGNLPKDKYFLQSVATTTGDGKLFFHKSNGGNTTGRYPIVSGFWDSSPTGTTNQYFIQLNNAHEQAPIGLEPRSYVFCVIMISQNVYANDFLGV